MEYDLKDFDIPAKDISKETLRMWRDAVSMVKDTRRRRFHHVADLEDQADHRKQIGTVKWFQLQEILSATNNFSDENLITNGGLEKVYKGQLVLQEKLMDVVVRRFNNMYGLQTEISMLSRFQGEHVISLVGSCDEKDEKIIVYEQAFHGILKQHLNDPTLTWSRRLHICLDVALALNHIRHDVIHCDINSSKIFLDKDWKPKIFGFEFSTEYPQSWRHRLLFPRCFNTTSMTPKYDVYSFGELMSEVLYGVKSMITEDGVKEGQNYIFDREQMNQESLNIFLKTAKSCLEKQLVERPTMNQIVKELEDALELQLNNENLGHSTAEDEGISYNRIEMDLLKIPLSEITKATKDFHGEYEIGSGGYGKVYLAELDVLDIQSLPSMKRTSKGEVRKIKKTVAIKRILRRSDNQGKEGFLTEIKLLSSCRDTNIVSLLGFCNEANEMILVYEYAFNKSLSDYLVSLSTRKIDLTWVQRIQICLDIASGLSYLHTKMKGNQRIIHRDIKSDNILLDENLIAKVADFGLSKLHATNEASTIQTSLIVGTDYYLDPEFRSTGKYKIETDIYSFGVVLFEILSGRLAYDATFINKYEKGLATVVKKYSEDKTLKDLIDPTMIEEDDRIFTLNRGPNEKSLNLFLEVACQCLNETQVGRPKMETVIEKLQNALKLQGETIILSRFQHHDIKLATDTFSETYCIGLDACSMLYKAELDVDNRCLPTTERKNNSELSKIRTNVAIKRISSGTGVQGKEAFCAEIEVRTSYKHPNIVSLLGFCDEGDDMMLVYEHSSNGSLDDYLKSANNMNNFTWIRRLEMCLKIAHGLHHLHTKMKIQHSNIHGDIRSANILLNKNLEPKIAYFGVSKLHQVNQEENARISHSGVGTKVYSDPEYEKNGDLGKESDVYSFGVVLFEIFCGRLAYDPIYTVKNDTGLAPIARRCFIDGRIEDMMDPNLKEEADEGTFTSNRVPNQDSLDKFSEIAYECLREAVTRPTLDIVIKELDEAIKLSSKSTFVK